MGDRRQEIGSQEIALSEENGEKKVRRVAFQRNCFALWSRSTKNLVPLSVRWFARSTHKFAYSVLLAELIFSLARSLTHSLELMEKRVIDAETSDCSVSNHSASAPSSPSSLPVFVIELQIVPFQFPFPNHEGRGSIAMGIPCT